MTQNTLSPNPKQPGNPLPTADAVLSASLSQQSADVEISTEKRASRERRILASVIIPQPIDHVWKIVTDYEHLADFIPSLSSSKRLHSPEGRIRLEQIGTQCFLKVKFCARVVLEMTENFPHEVGFSMQEGDFKMFKGAWHLAATENEQETRLSYDLYVKPPLAMPVSLIEHHLRHNLSVNMQAIHNRALQLAAQS